MKVIATIEARMTSSRLPGKVLLPVMGKPILHYLVARLKQVASLDGIVLATTINATDDSLVKFAEEEGIDCFRGSEEDVMTRVIGAGESVGADVIVEITGDCPIIDPEIVEQTIRMFQAHNVDYVSNNHIRSYPDGMDTQVFRLDALKRSASMTDDELDHEHVTLHIRNNPKLFSRIHLVAPPEIHWPELGLTLDEQADYDLIKQVMEYFNEENLYFSCLEVVRYLRDNPELVIINQDVIRKGDT